MTPFTQNRLILTTRFNGMRPITETSEYDVAIQLRTPEEMAAYLDAWLSEAPDDIAGIARALDDIKRAKNMSQTAQQNT